MLQAAAILAAVGASTVALVIASQDRVNAQRVAAEDRRESARQARLMFELDAARRLSINLARRPHQPRMPGVSSSGFSTCGAGFRTSPQARQRSSHMRAPQHSQRSSRSSSPAVTHMPD